MKTKSVKSLIVLSVLLLAIVVSACQPAVKAETETAVEAPKEEESMKAPEAAPKVSEDDAPKLATAMVSAQLSNQPGRAIVSARGNHFIVDSVPPLEGPNEELNPLDMILSSFATCGLFVAEKVALDDGIPLTDLVVTAEGDLNPAGVKDGSVSPNIQIFRVHMMLPGASDEQVKTIVDNFETRCPIYNTLVRSAPVEITVGDEEMSAPIEGLATAKVSAQLSNQPGRAIMTARGNHSIVDSVPPLGGPNEERNPLDHMLGALATCGMFVYERVALVEQGFPLTDIVVNVEADFDPQGVKDGSVNPRLQVFRVRMQLAGVDEAQADEMADQFSKRCPIYTTLEKSAPIEITHDL